jgi:hypothetical protein
VTKRSAGVGLVARLGPSAIFGPTLYDLYGSTEAGWVSVARPMT